MTEKTELNVGDDIYFLEDNTIQRQKILSTRMKVKIQKTNLLWTKDISVIEQALRNKLQDELDFYVKGQVAKFNS